MTDGLVRLAETAALLLSLATLPAGRLWVVLYRAQCAVLAVLAAAAALAASAPSLLLAAVALAAQGWAVPRLLRGSPLPAGHPSPALWLGSVGLVALALSLPLPDGFALPLSVVLLGLLAASAGGDPRFGVLLALNGAAAASCLTGGSWLPVAGLAGLAAVTAARRVPRLDDLR